MDEHKIDLTCLDPSRDHERWDRIVNSLAAKAWAARQRKLTVPIQLLAWARPALAIAAAVALVPWVASLARESGDETQVTTEQDPALVLAHWASQDERPAPSRILEVLGDRYERQ